MLEDSFGGELAGTGYCLSWYVSSWFWIFHRGVLKKKRCPKCTHVPLFYRDNGVKKTTSKPSKCSTPCQQASQIVSYIWVHPPHPKQDMTKLNRKGVVKCKLGPARSLVSFLTPPQKKSAIWRTSHGSNLHFWDPPPQECNLHFGSPPKRMMLRG